MVRTLIAGALALAGFVAVPSAQASHIFFQNIRINGQAIQDPGQPNVFTSPSGGVFTFTADFWSVSGDADNYNVTFNPAPGSTLALQNFSFGYAGDGTLASPKTLSFQQSPGLGTFNGTFTVNSPVSSPDFVTRAGNQIDSPTFNLTVTQTEAVPEPASLLLLGSGLVVGVAVRLRRRSQ